MACTWRVPTVFFALLLSPPAINLAEEEQINQIKFKQINLCDVALHGSS